MSLGQFITDEKVRQELEKTVKLVTVFCVVGMYVGLA